jgi:DNA-binding transcriptional ArsR family regulator
MPDDLDGDELVDALKALANPARLQIMEWLKDPEASFGEYEPIADRVSVGVCATHIQGKTGLAQSTVSAYMNALERAGLVIPTRVGKWTHYRRNEERLAQLARSL